VVPQPVKNEADILSIFKEALWAEDGTLRYTKMPSGGIGFTGADTDDLASAAEEIGQRAGPSTLNRRHRTLVFCSTDVSVLTSTLTSVELNADGGRRCSSLLIWWSTVSKAADRSRSIRAPTCPRSRTPIMSFKCRELLFPSNDVDGKPTGKLEAVDVF